MKALFIPIITLFCVASYGQAESLVFSEKAQQIQSKLSRYKQATSREETAGLEGPDSIIHEIKNYDQDRACKILSRLPSEHLLLLEPHLYEIKDYTCYSELKEILGQLKAFYNITFENQKVGEEIIFQDGQLIIKKGLDTLLPVNPPEPYLPLSLVDTKKAEVVYRKDLVDGGYSVLDLKEGEIILTFDDGPHPSRTSDLLDIFKKHGIKVNIFSVGKNAKKFPFVLERAKKEGHVIGSHSQNHPQLSRMDLPLAEREILNGHENVIRSINGEDSSFFRFPYGARNFELLAFLKDERIASFFWNMDSLDWKIVDPSKLYNQVVEEINRERKGVLLFHDIHNQTVAIMDTLLENLKKAGYQIRLAYPKKWVEE